VTIGGSTYVPPLPVEPDVKERMAAFTASQGAPIDTAVTLCLYAMKTRIFLDGNKHAAVIFANQYHIAHG